MSRAPLPGVAAPPPTPPALGLNAGALTLSLGLHAVALALLLPWGEGPASRPGISSVQVTLVPGEAIAPSAGVPQLAGVEAGADLAAAPPETADAPAAPAPPQEDTANAEAPAPEAPRLARDAPAAPLVETHDFTLARVAEDARHREPPPPAAAPADAPAPRVRPAQVAAEPRQTPKQAEPKRAESNAEAMTAAVRRSAPVADLAETDPAGADADQQAATGAEAEADDLLSRLPSAPDRSIGNASRASATGGLSESYAASLLRHIERFKRYPEEARRLRLHGAVRLTVTLDRRGRLLSASLPQPSPYRPLNQEATAVAGRAAPYPDIPAGLGETFTFTVTLRFEP